MRGQRSGYHIFVILFPFLGFLATSFGITVFGENRALNGNDPVIDVLTVITTEGKATADSIAEEEIAGIIELIWNEDGNYDQPLPEYDEAEWLQEIVEEIYADATVSSSVPLNVLNYMEGIFSEYDFYDSGISSNWSSSESMGYTPSFPSDLTASFVRPVLGRLTSGFGYRPSFRRIHKGVDISLRTGDTVRAALPGIVRDISFEPGGYGNYIVLAHKNGIETRYAHLNGVLVTKGDKVTSGSPIGLGGTTGNSTGPHLHFETRYRGVAVDPLSVFDFNNLRISPKK